VIIPARNAAATIGAQLDALAGERCPVAWEVVVVDNGSTDATAELVERRKADLPGLRRVAAPKAYGANVARNAGCRATEAAALLFCDADDVIEAGWLGAMVRALTTYPVVGGAIERRSLNPPAAVAGRPHRWDGLFDTFHYLPYGLTANCGARREVWEQLGGFSEEYVHGSDDCEFFWRAQLAGYEVGYVAEAIVHYRLRTGLRSMMRQYYDYGRSHVCLFRDFSAHGMPPSPPAPALREWGRLAAGSASFLGSPEQRVAWAMQVAMRAGRIVGSIRTRTLYL
jgi:glycosyltransferase involved in cell wall biosynthesis